MRKYVIFILFLAIVGVGVSFYLIPNQNQIAAMQQRDEVIRTASNINYQQQYDSGARTEEVMVGLTNQYINEGRGLTALPMLEEHLKLNPGHIQARKKLAELYQAAGRNDDYLREIETVVNQQPTEANLKLLSDMYNFVGLYDKQIDTLRQLVKTTDGSKPEYYADLATILTVQERKQEAAEVLKELRAKHPNYASYKITRLLVSSLVDSGEVEQGYQEAAKWINEHSKAPAPAADEKLAKDGHAPAPAIVGGPHPLELADLANIINYGGRPDLALQLIEPHRAIVTGHADLFLAYVNASINANKSDQAYEALKATYEQGKLQAPLYRPFIELAMNRGEMELAEHIVGSLDSQYFTEDEAINLIELARIKENKPILDKLVHLFDNQVYTKDKPGVAAIIALVRRDRDEDAKIARALSTDLTRNTRLRLAEACARNNKNQCFNTVVSKFKPFAEMTPRELDEVVMLYITVGRQGDIYEKVTRVAEGSGNGSPIIQFAHAKLAASMGKADVVSRFMNTKGRDTETAKLTQLFFIANDRRHSAIASMVAEFLYEREPSQAHREYLVSAYLRSGQYAKALPLVREIRNTSRVNEDSYLTTLTRLAKGDPALRDELKDYVVTQLQSPEVDEHRKLQLVFMLINSGNKKEAIPYIDQYADASPEWKKLYRQVHAKPWKGVATAGRKPARKPVAEVAHLDGDALASEPFKTASNKPHRAHKTSTHHAAKKTAASHAAAQTHTTPLTQAKTLSISKPALLEPVPTAIDTAAGQAHPASVNAAPVAAAPTVTMPPVPMPEPFEVVDATPPAPAAPVSPLEMPADYRLDMAMDPATSEETRRMLAFSLLNDGHREDAIYVFRYLAQDKGPDSQEVKDLLYLWGQNLNQEQVAWLSQRATQSTGADFIKWTEYVSSYGDKYSFMVHVADNPAALDHPSIRYKYLTALATSGSKDAFDKGMRGWVNTQNDPRALKDYVDIAKAYGYRDAAVNALTRIDRLAPNNESILKDLGVLTFSQSNYKGAERYINRYLQTRGASKAPQTHPFEAYFFKAELLRRAKKNQEAGQFYSQILLDGPAVATTLQRQSMYYSSQMHLGYHKEAKEGFYGLMEQFPEDKSLLADFMSMLLEYKYYDEAAAVANQFDSSSPYYYPSKGNQALSIQSRHIDSVESLDGGRQLAFHFNRPLGDDAPTFDPKEYRWLEGQQTNYDTIVIAAKPGYELRFTPTAKNNVEVIPMGREVSPDEEQRKQADLRLQLLYARLELETGQEQQALTRLKTLEDHYPKDPQLLAYTANAENYTGNWTRAIGLLEQAQEGNPHNEDVATLKHDIERLHADNINIDYEWRRTGKSDEYITTLNGKVRPTTKLELGGTLQHNRLHASQIRRSFDGQIGDYKAEKERAEVYAAYHFDNGGRLQASGFVNNSTPGGGLYYGFNNALGRSEVLAEYHRPYWDFVEAVKEEATRDRVGIKHTANLTNKTFLSSEASLNRYNIKNINNVAETALLRANVVHQLRSQQPYLGVAYGLDREQVIDKEHRNSAVATRYSPFPINSREIHSLTGIVAHNITDSTRAELVGGYAYDRLGQHGPVVEGRITQGLSESVDAQVRARYGTDSNNSANTATSVGGNLKVKF